MPFELPALPYDRNALEPHISTETMEYHHGTHHQGYITRLNQLVADTEDDGKSLEELIINASGTLFDQAAQAWNHTFYWHCLSPQGGGVPSGTLGERIASTFGSFDAFKEAFATKAMNHFGAGWVWLIKSPEGGLDIVTTANADTPIAYGQIPLLTVDLWEHAYYLDYRHARDRYLENIWKLVNWDFVVLNYG